MSAYHYVLTLQCGVGEHAVASTFVGTFMPSEDQTRWEAFRQIREHSAKQMPPGDSVVVFWSMELDSLGEVQR